MATLFFWAVFGALAGAFAKLVLWDNRHESLAAALLLGIAGAVGGGFLRVAMAGADQPGAIPAAFDGLTMLLTLLGAVSLLGAYYMFAERRSAMQASGPMRRHAA